MNPDDLDRTRIRRVVVERRALNRAIEWTVARMFLMPVVAAMLAWTAIRGAARGESVAMTVLLVVGAVLAVYQVMPLRRRLASQRRQRDALRSAEGPAGPIDFSHLSDGSQIADALRDMAGRRDGSDGSE